MAVETTEIIINSKRERKPNVGDKTMTRRHLGKLFARLVGGGVGLAIGTKLGLDLSRSPSKPERSPSPTFNVETYDFPLDYKHDLMLPPTPKVAATDNGVSKEISPGVCLVMLSDTLQGQLTGPQDKQNITPGSEHWVNNIALLFDENTQEVTFITGPNDKNNKETSWIVPPFDGEENRINRLDGVSTYYWPQDTVVENDDLFVTLVRNKPHVKDMWWDLVGTDIAIFKNSKLNTEPEIIKLPRNDSQTHVTSWGTAILQDGKKEWTYIAGSTEPLQNNPWHTKELRMARVPYGQMDQLQRWQFWNGKEWTSVDPQATTDEQIQQGWKDAEKEATTIIDNTQGLSQGYSMHNIDGQVVLTTKNTDFLGETIDVFLGDSPVGPYKKHTIIDKEELQKLIPESYRPDNNKSWTYLALLHPEVKDPENADRMLVTFCISPDVDKPGEAMNANVNTYRRIPVWIDKNKILNKDTAKV